MSHHGRVLPADNLSRWAFLRMPPDLLDFPGADVRRGVPQRAGLRAALWRERLRVRCFRRYVLLFPGAHVRRDVPHGTGLRCVSCRRMRVRSL